MTRVWVRGLWGDGITIAREKCLQDVRTTIEKNLHPFENILDYSFGVENDNHLRSLGLNPILKSNEPVLNFAGIEQRISYEGILGKPLKKAVALGEINYGFRFWYHKLLCIEDALTKFDEVIWMDWDVWVIRPVPADYWDCRSAGPPLQCAMRNLLMGTFGWRKYGHGQSPHGGMIYCREVQIIRDLLELQKEFPTFSDEHLIAVWIERKWGQWTEAEYQRWYDEGWELPFYLAPAARRPRSRNRIFAHKGNGRR